VALRGRRLLLSGPDGFLSLNRCSRRTITYRPVRRRLRRPTSRAASITLLSPGGKRPPQPGSALEFGRPARSTQFLSGPRRRSETKASEERLGRNRTSAPSYSKRRRDAKRPYRLASGPPPLTNIDSLAGDFLLSIVRKERSLRSFWLFFAEALFALRAHMGRQSTSTAAPSVRPPSKGRNLVGIRICGSGSRDKSPTPRLRVGRGGSTTSHSRSPSKTTRGRWCLAPEFIGARWR
jgi:hypothetical protein